MGKENLRCTHTQTLSNGLLCSNKKEWNLAICNSVDGPKGCYAKWNKSDREKHIPYNFTYMWNLKNKVNNNKKKQTT